MMRRAALFLTTAVLATLSVTLSVGAQAETALFGGRVGAVDVPKIAKFYEAVFGLKETNRLELPGLFEIMMNFGDTVDAAKKNKNPMIVLMRRESDKINDTIPHLIFTVSDIKATVEAVKANGGKMEGDLKAFGKSTLGFAVDPAGNQIEIIQQGK